MDDNKTLCGRWSSRSCPANETARAESPTQPKRIVQPSLAHNNTHNNTHKVTHKATHKVAPIWRWG